MKKLVFDLQRFDRFENQDNNATITGTDGDDNDYVSNVGTCHGSTLIGSAGDEYISLTAYAYQHYIVYSEDDGSITFLDKPSK